MECGIVGGPGRGEGGGGGGWGGWSCHCWARHAQREVQDSGAHYVRYVCEGGALGLTGCLRMTQCEHTKRSWRHTRESSSESSVSFLTVSVVCFEG